jgi:GYF domain 2
MGYLIKRGEQTFGPYSLTDLQRYVQSGNVLLEDLAQSEGLSDWVPVRQVLGDIPTATASTTPVVAGPVVEHVPLPPNLHWAGLLVLNILTSKFFNLFNLIWALILANWGRKLSGDNKPLVLVAMYPASMVAGFIAISMHVFAVGGLLILGGLIVYLFGIFAIREAMEDYYNSVENIGLTLSGPMTFFFSTVYLQYHVNRIARWKATGTLT